MFLRVIRTMSGGFLMGTADLVPGVSGGTIALVLGIYERLVASIREGSSALGKLVRGDLDAVKQHLARVEWLFVISLLGGIGVAIIVLSSVIEHFLEEQPVIMAAAFFGLVIGSLYIAWGMIREPGAMAWVVAASVGLLFFLVLGIRVDTAVADPGSMAIVGSGALAISAMILPGISGSLILVLLGMYEVVLGAVNDRDWTTLGLFALGAIMGLALFSQILHWALEHYHDLVLAALIGLMAGSLRILWPWPGGVDSSALGAPESGLVGALVASMIGTAAVFAITRLGAREPTP